MFDFSTKLRIFALICKGGESKIEFLVLLLQVTRQIVCNLNCDFCVFKHSFPKPKGNYLVFSVLSLLSVAESFPKIKLLITCR